MANKRHLEDRERRGYVNHPLYLILMDAVYAVPGDFIEMGVWRGATFKYIYNVAKRQRKNSVAVDSFIGMPEGRTKSESKRFPKGAFSVNGPGDFIKRFPDAHVYAGFIPEILEKLPHGMKLSFAHLDLDHEQTTTEALEWVWPRISNNGILVCHDFHYGSKDCAPKAIEEWMKRDDILPIGIADHSIYFRKGAS